MLDAQNYFRDLGQQAFRLLHGSELMLLNYYGEASDFVRFNRARIRQGGSVMQHELELTLIDLKRQAQAQFNLSGDLATDRQQLKSILASLREQLRHLPEDPYLHYATQVRDSLHVSHKRLPETGVAVDTIVKAAEGLDMVGIWASGHLYRGFANSLGQHNWHSDGNFNFDWSVYQQGDKAVKQNYAGTDWQTDTLLGKLDYARETLALLGQPARSIPPGKYRVFLAPAALEAILELLNWGGFGLKSHRTAQTPLLRMVREDRRLDPRVRMVEHHRAGLAADFTRQGFILPEHVELIDKGRYRDCLCNHRSALEYGETVNCDQEAAGSLEMDGGQLHQNDVLKALGTGVYISNLWYTNYSDRNNARITGMTRFACLWVENGVAVAPLNVMRFDESVLEILGDKLVDITEEREHILDPSSYGQRSHASWKLPGVLLDDFRFTL